jgi:hypothetical protein
VFITEGILRRDLEEMVALLDRVAQRTAAARERAQQEPQSTPAGGQGAQP